MNHKDIETLEFKKLMEEDSFIILDVRTPEEHNAERLKGAANINFYHESFEDELDKLDKRKKYLLYCRSGNRSRQTMFLMRDLGFDEVYNLQEGIISWNENGFETEK